MSFVLYTLQFPFLFILLFLYPRGGAWVRLIFYVHFYLRCFFFLGLLAENKFFLVLSKTFLLEILHFQVTGFVIYPLSVSHYLSYLTCNIQISDCQRRSHWSCGVSGKRIEGAFTSPFSRAPGNTEHPCSALLKLRPRCLLLDTFVFRLPENPHSDARPGRAVRILRPRLGDPRLTASHPTASSHNPGRNVKELRRKSLQGRRLRMWLENGLFQQHLPGGWTTATAAPEPHTAGGYQRKQPAQNRCGCCSNSRQRRGRAGALASSDVRSWRDCLAVNTVWFFPESDHLWVVCGPLSAQNRLYRLQLISVPAPVSLLVLSPLVTF